MQFRRSHAQERAYCGRRQPEPYGNGLVVVAFILEAQRGRISFGKPIDGGAAVHTGKLCRPERSGLSSRVLIFATTAPGLLR